MELLACILFVNQLKTIYKAFKILIRYLFFPILGYNGNWKRKRKKKKKRGKKFNALNSSMEASSVKVSDYCRKGT